MASKTYKPTRPKTQGYFYIKKDAQWLESPAYRDLTPIARCLLEELQMLYRPGRNGTLSLSTANAAVRLNVTENTIKQPFYDLIEHGFIVLTKGHIFIERQAREWRLTIETHNNHEPTDDWKNWSPGNPVRVVPQKKSRPQKSRQLASNSEAKLPEKSRQSTKRRRDNQ